MLKRISSAPSPPAPAGRARVWAGMGCVCALAIIHLAWCWFHLRCMHCGGVRVGGQGIPCRGPPQRISAAGVGSSPAPAPAGRARVRAGPGMRSRTCHVRSCYSFFVCGVLHVSVGADTASAWRRPNVLWALDLHTVYRGDATERRHSACPPNQAPHKVCLMFFSVAVPLALGIEL